MPTTDNRNKCGPLHDYTVLELGQLIAGPFCGQLLGDLGAEVVKVEAPGKGDPLRQWGNGNPKTWWQVIARNKYSLSLDLRKEAGQDIIRRLVSESDILIENFRPGTLEKWGLSPESLTKINPGLIIVRISGFGQTGPYAHRPGFGSIGEAVGGWRHIVGSPDRPPSRMGISIGDTLAATYGAMGALAALNARNVTGQGQVIDVSLYESVLQVMECLIPEYSVAGVVRERTGSILPGIAPSNVYTCIDGDYLIAANQDTVFGRLCAAMGRPELAEDNRFFNHEARGTNQSELDALINAWTSSKTREQIEALMTEHAVPASKIYTAADMLDDPHFAARETIIDVPHAALGSIKMQNCFPRFSETQGSVRFPAPDKVGQDTDFILESKLALSGEEIAKLRADKVVE